MVSLSSACFFAFHSSMGNRCSYIYRSSLAVIFCTFFLRLCCFLRCIFQLHNGRSHRWPRVNIQRILPARQQAAVGLTAGWVFFRSAVVTFGNGISKLLINAIQLGNVLSLKHNVYFFVLCLIFHNSKQNAVLLGQFLKLSHVFALQGNNFQFFCPPAAERSRLVLPP